MSIATSHSGGTKYNWSGHVTLDNEMSGFFKQLMDKNTKFEVKRKCGLLPVRPYRNPLKCEKTPRIDYKGFCFDIPPPMEGVEKWKYPESDRGLISKFPSQKPVFDNLYAKEREYEEQVKKCKEAKAQREQDIRRQQQQAHQNGTQSNQFVPVELSQSQAPKSAGKLVPLTTTNIEEHNRFNSTLGNSIKNNNDRRSGSKKQVADGEVSLYDQPVSTMKLVASTNPEILADWRAKRAAKYVNAQKHPAVAPTPREVSGLAFRPPGNVLPDSFAKIVDRSPTRKIAVELRDNTVQLENLLREYEATEREIRRQEKKLHGTQKHSHK